FSCEPCLGDRAHLLPITYSVSALSRGEGDQHSLDILGGRIERHFLRPVIGYRGNVALATDEGRGQVHIVEVVVHNPGADVATRGRVVWLLSHHHHAVGFPYRRRDRLFVDGHKRAKINNV